MDFETKIDIELIWLITIINYNPLYISLNYLL